MAEMLHAQRSVVIRIHSKTIEDGGKVVVSLKETSMSIIWITDKEE